MIGMLPLILVCSISSLAAGLVKSSVDMVAAPLGFF